MEPCGQPLSQGPQLTSRFSASSYSIWKAMRKVRWQAVGAGARPVVPVDDVSTGPPSTAALRTVSTNPSTTELFFGINLAVMTAGKTTPYENV